MKVYRNSIPAPEFVNHEGRYDTALYEERCEKYLEDTRAMVLSVGQPHPLAGEVVRTPYADGYAEYMIAKFDGKVCLVWLEMWDAWSDPLFEKAVTVTMLKEKVAAQKRLAELFKKGA